MNFGFPALLTETILTSQIKKTDSRAHGEAVLSFRLARWIAILIIWLGVISSVCVFVCAGLIIREDGSMAKELEELRRSRPKPPVGGDFTLSDCFYFTRRGIESIVEDEVQVYCKILHFPSDFLNVIGTLWFVYLFIFTNIF